MDASKTTTIIARSPGETVAAGARIGAGLSAGDVVCLSGDLGAGKTTLVKGIVRGLGVKAEAVSPTFTIVNEYGGSGGEPLVFHMDCYRLCDEDEMEEIGFGDYLERGGVLLVEWPERIAGLIPDGALRVRLERDPDPANEDVRRITIEGGGAR